jgi:hypothetical protein
MKRMITECNSGLHLRDILRDVIYVEICYDVTMTPTNISASEEVSDEFNERILLKLSDSSLKKISDETLARITDTDLLRRLEDICPERLLENQIEILRDWYANAELIIDEQDVCVLLEKIKKCNTAICLKSAKNKKFAYDKDGRLRTAECLSVLKSLSLDDHVENMYGADDNYFGDQLIVFHKNVDWTLKTGEFLEDVLVYIKLDIDRTDGDCVVLVSFHEAEYEE